MAVSLGTGDDGEPRINVCLACRYAGIARKTYYRRKAEGKDGLLIFWIEEIQRQNRFSLGTRMLKIELSKYGLHVSRRRIKRIMDDYGFNCRIRIKKVPDGYCRKQKEQGRDRKNLINRQFHAFKPRQRMLTDITCLRCKGGFVYLSAIRDLFNHGIPAYAFSDRCDAALCVDTVDILAGRSTRGLSGMILHSDQGSTYTASPYCDRLRDLGIRQSFSRIANCWDNAAMESFFGILKDYIRACFGRRDYEDGRVPAERIKKATADFIDHYNSGRPQLKLGSLSPDEYLAQNQRGTAIVPRTEGETA